MSWNIDSSFKKGFTKSKGGESGKKKMGEFEDELASCMMNPKMFDCEELEHLSGGDGLRQLEFCFVMFI